MTLGLRREFASSNLAETVTITVPDPSSTAPSEFTIPASGWKRIAFIALNLLVAFHIFAIIACPLSSEPSSPLAKAAFGKVSWYLDLLYLDHAFRFFVPDPGASTLVEYTAELPDGTVKTGQFPNRDIFPRLRYHRYFMLSEYLGNGPEELAPYIKRAFARNICRETGASRVTLTQVVHDMPLLEDFRKGVTLQHADLFMRTPLGEFTAESLSEPFVPTTPTLAPEEAQTQAGPVERPSQAEEVGR